MTNVVYKVQDIEVSASITPRIKINRSTGDDGYTVILACDGAFTDLQIAACVLGTTTSISVDNLKFTGIVTGFGSRVGYSIVQIEDAAVVAY